MQTFYKKKEELNPLLVIIFYTESKSISKYVLIHLLKQISVQIGNILYESK